MDIESFRDHCLAKSGATESIPFSKLPDLLVFKVKGKMFTAIDLVEFDGFSIKCHPDSIDALRAQYACLEKPAYFSDRHWCRVVLDGSVNDELLFEWLDTSYQLVVANLPRKTQAELIGGSEI